MKIPAGFPFFDPPKVQRQTQAETGLYFVPTKGADAEGDTHEHKLFTGRFGKILKIVLLSAAIIAFVVLGVIVLSGDSSLAPIFVG